MLENIPPKEGVSKELSTSTQVAYVEAHQAPQESSGQAHEPAGETQHSEDTLAATGSRYRTPEEMDAHMREYGAAVSESLKVYLSRRFPISKNARLTSIDDIMQQTMLEWLRKEAKTDSVGSDEHDRQIAEIKWARGIANVMLLRESHAYATRRDRLLPEGDEEAFSFLSDPGPSAEEPVIHGLAQDSLLLVLRQAQVGLSERHQEVIEILIQDPDIEVPELASALNATLGATRVAKNRAINRLVENILKLRTSLLDLTDPTIQHLLQLVDDRCNDQAQRSIAEYDGPPITPEAQRQRLAVNLAHSRTKEGASSAELYVPQYIGMWSVAAHDIANFANNHDRSMIGIAYPHEALLEDFSAYIGRIVGTKVLESLRIGTPQEIALAAKKHNFDYLVGPGEIMHSNPEAYSQSGFQLRLFNAGEPCTTEQNIHTSPLYNRMGVRKVIWSPWESIQYVHEYFLTTGKLMNKPIAKALCHSGQGPGDHLVSKEYGGWNNLREAAERMR